MSVLLFLLLQFEPLPDLDEFLEITKAELVEQLDEQDLLEGYTYRRRTIRDDQVKEHDIFQFDAGLYTRLVSKNGVIARRQDLEKQGSGPPFSPKSDEDRRAMIDDMFRVWSFQMVRRDNVQGRPALVIAFEPREDAKPQTRSGRWFFRNTRGVAWVDELDHRIVRMHTTVINDISLAWGLFAKVHKGTEILREWRKVDDEVWLPSMSLKRFRARAFMVGLNFQEIEQYFDYRKLDVETKLQFCSPK